MGSLVGFLTSSRRGRRHPRWMLRIAAACTTAGLLALVGGYVALGAAGQDAAAPAAAVATTTPMVASTSDDAVSLPPLPSQSRARSVAPVAGESSSSSDALADPGLDATDAKPTKEASAAVRG